MSMHEPHERLEFLANGQRMSLSEDEILKGARTDLRDFISDLDEALSDHDIEERDRKVCEEIDRIAATYADSYSESPCEEWLKDFLSDYWMLDLC